VATCHLDAHRGLDGIFGVFLEVCPPTPPLGGGAVRHGEAAVALAQSPCKDLDPDGDDAREVLEEVVGGAEPEVGGEVEPPGEAKVGVPAQTKGAGV